jgi:hypothetical protein
MTGGDYKANLGGLDHYKIFGYKGIHMFIYVYIYIHICININIYV